MATHRLRSGKNNNVVVDPSSSLQSKHQQRKPRTTPTLPPASLSSSATASIATAADVKRVENAAKNTQNNPAYDVKVPQLNGLSMKQFMDVANAMSQIMLKKQQARNNPGADNSGGGGSPGAGASNDNIRMTSSRVHVKRIIRASEGVPQSILINSLKQDQEQATTRKRTRVQFEAQQQLPQENNNNSKTTMPPSASTTASVPIGHELRAQILSQPNVVFIGDSANDLYHRQQFHKLITFCSNDLIVFDGKLENGQIAEEMPCGVVLCFDVNELASSIKLDIKNNERIRNPAFLLVSEVIKKKGLASEISVTKYLPQDVVDYVLLHEKLIDEDAFASLSASMSKDDKAAVTNFIIPLMAQAIVSTANDVASNSQQGSSSSSTTKTTKGLDVGMGIDHVSTEMGKMAKEIDKIASSSSTTINSSQAAELCTTYMCRIRRAVAAAGGHMWSGASLIYRKSKEFAGYVGKSFMYVVNKLSHDVMSLSFGMILLKFVTIIGCLYFRIKDLPMASKEFAQYVMKQLENYYSTASGPVIQIVRVFGLFATCLVQPIVSIIMDLAVGNAVGALKHLTLASMCIGNHFEATGTLPDIFHSMFSMMVTTFTYMGSAVIHAIVTMAGNAAIGMGNALGFGVGTFTSYVVDGLKVILGVPVSIASTVSDAWSGSGSLGWGYIANLAVKLAVDESTEYGVPMILGSIAIMGVALVVSVPALLAGGGGVSGTVTNVVMGSKLKSQIIGGMAIAKKFSQGGALGALSLIFNDVMETLKKRPEEYSLTESLTTFASIISSKLEQFSNESLNQVVTDNSIFAPTNPSQLVVGSLKLTDVFVVPSLFLPVSTRSSFLIPELMKCIDDATKVTITPFINANSNINRQVPHDVDTKRQVLVNQFLIDRNVISSLPVGFVYPNSTELSVLTEQRLQDWAKYIKEIQEIANLRFKETMSALDERNEKYVETVEKLRTEFDSYRNRLLSVNVAGVTRLNIETLLLGSGSSAMKNGFVNINGTWQYVKTQETYKWMKNWLLFKRDTTSINASSGLTSISRSSSTSEKLDWVYHHGMRNFKLVNCINNAFKEFHANAYGNVTTMSYSDAVYLLAGQIFTCIENHFHGKIYLLIFFVRYFGCFLINFCIAQMDIGMKFLRCCLGNAQLEGHVDAAQSQFAISYNVGKAFSPGKLADGVTDGWYDSLMKRVGWHASKLEVNNF